LPALPTQEADTLSEEEVPAINPGDTLNTPGDTVRMNLPPQPQQAKGDIETKINYGAKDSSRMDIPNKMVYLYGDAFIEYGTIKLEAAQISINWKENTLTAVGVKDSANKVQGKPVFSDGPETYVTDQITYNFKNRKALIRGVVTQQDDGYIHGDWVEKDAEDNLYVKSASYTTCNLEDPHFEIAATKLKAIPGDKIIAGPFNLRIANINTPLGFLFGMFPQPRKKTSGIIMPSYGEENRRGFFLRDGGYYFAISDYIDMAVTGELYTKGSRGLQLASNYRKRYRYSGNFNIRYNRNVTGDEGLENINTAYWVNWSHSPQSRGTSRFSASVNAGSSSFTQNNPSLNNLEQNLNQQFTSNISWGKTFPNSPFSLNARANLNQDIAQNTFDLTLPDVGLTMNRIYPFKSRSGSNKGFIRQINFSYTGAATNKLSNRRAGTINGLSGINILNETDNSDPLGFDFNNLPELWRRSSSGVRHSIPVSTSVNVLKYFTLSPSFNYQEVWSFRRLEFTDFNRELGGVRVDTVGGFNRSGSWNASAGLSTRVYGTFYVGGKRETPKIQAIRHMIVPNVSLSYAPDYSRESSGNYQEVLVGYDENDEPIYRQVLQFQGGAFNPPAGQRQGNISFGITNNIEMKVLDKKDTVNTTYKKVPLLERFSVNSSYNAIADSFKLQDISFSGNTRLFNNLLTVQFGGRLNPYQYRLDSTFLNQNGELQVRQREIDRYVWEDGGLPTLENVNFNLSTSFSSKGAGSQSGAQQPNAGGNLTTQRENALGEGTPLGNELGQEGLAYRYDDPNEYVDFNLPWSLRVNYTFQYNKRGMQVSEVTQSMNFSGDLKLTEKWKIGFNSAYNFEEKDFTSATRLSIHRDLHCWQMDVNWVPLGPFQSFSVDIRVKAPTLQDLKLSRRRSFWDN
jgi:hypothetical protein